MITNLSLRLEDPLYDLLVVAAIMAVALGIMLVRRPGTRRRLAAAFAPATREGGSAQLTQQSISAAITIAIAAFSIALIGYAVLMMVWTGICGNNITQISAAEDLRFSRGYGYTANGNVTAAAFVDSDGNNDYLKSTPADPAAPSGAMYTFTGVQTNGDWTYTVDDPATASHAGWTTLKMQGGANTTTHLQELGPGGVVSAH